MKITTDDWMNLVDNVITELSGESQQDFDEKIQLFMWEKYCALHHKVNSYIKNIERTMFSEPTSMLQRIFLHRTQEFDGLNANIGIPLAFKLQDLDEHATFTFQESSYCDFYFLNKYRTIGRDQVTDGQEIEVGLKINVSFIGQPLINVTGLEEDGSLRVEGRDEVFKSKSLMNVDRNKSNFEVGDKAIILSESPSQRLYRCEVLSVGERIGVKILRYQGYPDDLVHRLSLSRVTMERETFLGIFSSYVNSVDGSEELYDCILKYLGRGTIKLSRLKKSSLASKRDHLEPLGAALRIDDSLFSDLDQQADKTVKANVPGVYLSFDSSDKIFGLDDVTPKKKAWFKTTPNTTDTFGKFIKLAKTMTALRAMESSFMSVDFIEARVKKTIEKIVGQRPEVGRLSKPYKMLLDLEQLYNYSYESLEDHYQNEDLDTYIKKQMIPLRDFFDCREVEIPVDLSQTDENDEIAYESIEIESDEEEDVTAIKLIKETNANSQSDLRESQFVQWPVGDFKYWPKVRDVVDKLLDREKFLLRGTQKKAVGAAAMKRSLFDGTENEFKTRISCMLTSNGRDFLEKHFEEFRLPSRDNLLRVRTTLRPSLNDIFLILLLRFYILNDVEDDTTCIDLLSSLVLDMLNRFFNGLNITFLDKKTILDFTFNIFGNSRIRLKKDYFQPLLYPFENRTIISFKKRLEEQIKKPGYTPVCLVKQGLNLQDYLSRALQVGVYLTKKFKTSRQSSDSFFDLFKVLFLNNAQDTEQIRTEFDTHTKYLKNFDAEIRKNLYLKKTARNKDTRERKAQYYRDKRDSLLTSWLKRYIEVVRKNITKDKKQNFYLCDALISLIALNCVASFEHSNLDYLLQTLLINFLERGTLDLGTYVQMWYFENNDVENHWIRCKDKTTVEVISFCRFAEIDSKFCMFNTNEWDKLTRSNLFLHTPISNWGEVKGFNCNQHSLYMSYDIESVKKTSKTLKDIRNFNTLHNPSGIHSAQAQKKVFSHFQMQAFKKKKLTGVAWSIGDLLGQTVVHLGSEFFLTFNNIFGCLSNANYMPFEKFKPIGNTPDDVQKKMYTLFLEVYAVRYGKIISIEKMKKRFFQNVGYIKSNYKSLDLDAKLPRHNYVIKVDDFVKLLYEFSSPTERGGLSSKFLQKLCTTILKGIDKTKPAECIKKLGEIFYSKKFEVKSNIWSKQYSWKSSSWNGPTSGNKGHFRIQRLVELILLADFATAKGMGDYRFRFHERLNKINLAFCYRFSQTTEWAKEHKYFEKLRKKNINVDCSHFYLEVPKCNPVISLSTSIIPIQNFFQRIQDPYNSIISDMIDLFDFKFTQREEIYQVSLTKKKDTFFGKIDSVIEEIHTFMLNFQEMINYEVSGEKGFFKDIGVFKKKLVQAEKDLIFFQEYDEELVPNAKINLQKMKYSFDEQQLYFGRPLYLFLREMRELKKFLRTLKSGTPSSDTQELTNNEAELREDILDSLRFPYIKELYGASLLKIIHFDIFKNGPTISRLVEKIMKRILPRLKILEFISDTDAENSDESRVKALLSTKSHPANKDQVSSFLDEYNLTELTSALRNLYDTLFDYFDDFDSAPVLTNLLMGKLELETLQKNLINEEEPNEFLLSYSTAILKRFDYIISVETLISDLQFAGVPYVYYGNTLRSKVSEMLQTDQKPKLEKIFSTEEAAGYTVDDNVLEDFKTSYNTIKPAKMIDSVYSNRLLSLEVNTKSAKALKYFMTRFSFSVVYKSNTESDIPIVDIEKEINIIRPSWFQTMKQSVGKKIDSMLNELPRLDDGFGDKLNELPMLDDGLGENDFEYQESSTYYRELQRMWNSIQKPSNRLLFEKFCQKVMKSQDNSFRSDIAASIRKKEKNVQLFFDIYFKDGGWLNELVVVRRARDWFSQLRKNIKDEICVEHKKEMQVCETKLNEVRSLKSPLFTKSFKNFYNSFADALQKNIELWYLLREIKPFLNDIETKTGFSLDLETPEKIYIPWLSEMKRELSIKIKEIMEEGETSTDGNLLVLKVSELSPQNFDSFLTNLEVVQHTKMESLKNILKKYAEDIERDIHSLSSDDEGKNDEDFSSSSSDDEKPNNEEWELLLTPNRNQPEIHASSSGRGSEQVSPRSDESRIPDSPSTRSDSETRSSRHGPQLSSGISSPEQMSPISDESRIPGSPSTRSDFETRSSRGPQLSSEISSPEGEVEFNPRSSVPLIYVSQAEQIFSEMVKSLENSWYRIQEECTDFIKEFFDEISVLLYNIKPAINPDLIHGDMVVPALKDLHRTLLIIFESTTGVTDLDFLEKLESIQLPDLLRHVQYRQNNITKNMFSELGKLIEETILGEFYWERDRVKIQFRSYLLATGIVSEREITHLKNYERFNGIREPFRARLSEVKEIISFEDKSREESKSEELSEEALYSEVSVYDPSFEVNINFIDLILQITSISFITESGNLQIKDKIVKPSDLVSAHDNIKSPSYRHLRESLQSVTDGIYDEFTKVVYLKNPGLQVEEITVSALKKAIEQVVIFSCRTSPKEAHFFKWGKGLKCAICSKDLSNFLHMETLTINPDIKFSEEIQKAVERINKIIDN